MTQKDELAQAQAKIADLEKQTKASEGLQTQLDQANTNLQAAEKARDDEKARADKAEDALKASEEKVTKANDDLKAAGERATKAEGEREGEKARADKAEKELGNADQTHAEQLAARNIPPVKKAATPAADAKDPEAKPTADQIRAQYEAIEDKTERYAFFEKHSAVLMG